MVDGLYGLGHYAVVRCYYQNRDIGSVGTTHTHSGKCFVSGSIQESDLTVSHIYSISTDVLGDTAGLTIGYIGLTDGIQQGSLTMVNVTHNTDYGRSLHQIFLFLFVFLQQFFDDIDLDLFFTENIILHGDVLCVLIRDLLVHGYDLALQEQLLDDDCGL